MAEPRVRGSFGRSAAPTRRPCGTSSTARTRTLRRRALRARWRWRAPLGWVGRAATARRARPSPRAPPNAHTKEELEASGSRPLYTCGCLRTSIATHTHRPSPRRYFHDQLSRFAPFQCHSWYCILMNNLARSVVLRVAAARHGQRIRAAAQRFVRVLLERVVCQPLHRAAQLLALGRRQQAAHHEGPRHVVDGGDVVVHTPRWGCRVQTPQRFGEVLARV